MLKQDSKVVELESCSDVKISFDLEPMLLPGIEADSEECWSFALKDYCELIRKPHDGEWSMQ